MNPLRIRSISAALASFCIGLSPAIQAQDGEITELNQRVSELQEAGRTTDAIPFAERASSLTEAEKEPEHPDTAQSLNHLAALYSAMGNYSKAEPLYGRALNIIERVPVSPAPENAELAALNKQISDLSDAGKYAEAIPLARKALKVSEGAMGRDHPGTAASLSQLAVLYDDLGDFSKAEEPYRRALAIYQKVLGAQHPATAPILSNLGSLFITTGDFTKAEPFFQRALAIREKAAGPFHPGTAQTLSALGSFYWTTGDYEKAEPLYERALAIREKALGPQHPETIVNLNSLASVCQAKGDYAKAGQLHQRALETYEKRLGPTPAEGVEIAALDKRISELQNAGKFADAIPFAEKVLKLSETTAGPDQPDTALSLDILAALYQAAGDYKKAKPLFQRALAIRERALGPKAPETTQSLRNLATLYRVAGDYKNAEPLFERVLENRETSSGPRHPATAQSLQDLASLYWAKGDYAKAEPLFQRALSIDEKALGPEHPMVASVLNNLAILYQYTCAYTKAELLFQRALAIDEKALGPYHVATATRLNNLGVLYCAMGDHAKAEPFFQRALAIRERVLNPEHPDTALTLENLAVVYQKRGKHAKAEPLFKRALEIYEKMRGPNDSDILNARMNLAMFYQATGAAAKAEPFLDRAHATAHLSSSGDPAVTTATKNAPFVNSLAMEFVPIPGTRVLFCRTDTRVKDYRKFQVEKHNLSIFVLRIKKKDGRFVLDWDLDANASWEKPGFVQTEDHPVVGVSWYEARMFCAWLSQREGRIYRLPTDEEWSAAAGPTKYPWGENWPPPDESGNYADNTYLADLESISPHGWKGPLKDYHDNYVRTSPVGRFPANCFGLYDMGGNVWQWCDTRYKTSMNTPEVIAKYPKFKNETAKDGAAYRVLRGGAWNACEECNLVSAYRERVHPTARFDTCGFRCVVELPTAASAEE